MSHEITSRRSTSFLSGRRLAGVAFSSVLVFAGAALLLPARASDRQAPQAAKAGSTAGRATTPSSKTAAATAEPPIVDAGTTQIAPDVAKLLAEIKRKDKGQLAVSEEDGQFLRLLMASTQRKRALEIGAASGYSAIWIGLGLRETGGKLVTIEYDPARAREAIDNVKRAGLADVVQVIKGDAFQEIPKLAGTFDCVFVDAWKRDYIKFFDMVFPRLDKGGLFLGHNVINKKSEMGDFLTRISTHPDLFTAIVAPSGEGVSVSYKRK
jgi:caffeoyl-CoA O-methyltransferase